MQWLLRTGRCLGLACGQRRREVLPAGAGWGGISSDDLPPGRDCWVSFAVIDMPGYRFLEEGDVVDVTCTASKQDSWDVVADRVRTV